MTARYSSQLRIAIAAAATLGGFFLLGFGGILITAGQGQSVSVIWPATAFGICMLLRQSRDRRTDFILLAAIFLAGLMANGVFGGPAPENLGYSAINTLDVMAGVWAARHFARPGFRTMATTLRFALAAAVAPCLLGATLAALVNALYGHPDWFASGTQWFFANLLGFCMVFPLGMSVSFRQFARLRLTQRIPEALAVAAVLVAFSILVFRLSTYPLQFLLIPAVLLATVRFRFLGGGAAMILIGAIALGAPVVTSSVMRILLLQLFLAVCSITSVRAAIVLNQRDLHLAINEIRRKRAARASRFKSRLLSHVNHEVRGPLSAIIGFSGMLESGSLPAASAQEFAHIIAHNGELLQRLHDDLLDLAAAEAGKLSIRPERVPVAQTLKNCVGAIRLDASLGGKSVVLEEMEESLAVNADPARLAQIINNLIANAYKYGDNFSPIRVKALRLPDGYGRIEIANAGPGIPALQRHALFKPFSRGEEEGRNVPGAGLGLSIAKLLVEKQGGRIDFDSVPGRQTRFWIDLPLVA